MSFLRSLVACCLLACTFSTHYLQAAELLWKAGIAKANITPSQALWLAGYGGRDKPADGKVMELWIKVLALEDARGHRAVILTSDLLGIPQSITSTPARLLRASSVSIRTKFFSRPPTPIAARSFAAHSTIFTRSMMPNER